jgi:hypothetical protein
LLTAWRRSALSKLRTQKALNWLLTELPGEMTLQVNGHGNVHVSLSRQYFVTFDTMCMFIAVTRRRLLDNNISPCTMPGELLGQWTKGHR